MSCVVLSACLSHGFYLVVYLVVEMLVGSSNEIYRFMYFGLRGVSFLIVGVVGAVYHLPYYLRFSATSSDATAD